MTSPRSGGNSSIPFFTGGAIAATGFFTISFNWIAGGVLIALGFITMVAMNVANEWNEAIILRFGKYHRKATAGVFWNIPILEDVNWIDTRIMTMDVNPQKVMTKDTVPVNIDAVIYYQVNDSKKAIIEVEDFESASSKFAQTSLRDHVGRNNLSFVLSQKEQLGQEIQETLDEETDDWGVRITNVEIRDVTLPDKLERAMAAEAEAEREKKARITKAEAEEEASKQLRKAADRMAESQGALTLRQLQTWQEIGAEQNTTLIVAPSDLVSGFQNIADTLDDRE